MAESGQSPQVNPGAVPSLAVRAQYMVDLSFESPGAPNSLGPREAAPQVSVGVDVNVRRGAENQFEVIMKLGARAHVQDDTIFAVELVYAGIFHIQNVPETNLQPILFIECPRLLFPFARRIVADVTRDGGFPPLMLETIDFVSLYQSRMAAAQSEGGTPRYDA